MLENWFKIGITLKIDSIKQSQYIRREKNEK